MDYGQPKMLHPNDMTPQQKRLDLLFALARCQFLITKAVGQITRRIVIGVYAIATHDTTERLLIGSVGAIDPVM